MITRRAHRPLDARGRHRSGAALGRAGLLCFSLVMVYSASIALADNPRFGSLSSLHFVLRHGASILLGILAGYWPS